MDAADIRALIELNNRFYAKHAASFSATRTRRWDGWCRLADLLEDAGWRKGDGGAGRGGAAGEDSADGRATGRPDATGAHRDILDLACGNLRFEAFLAQAFAGERIAAHAVDSCPALAQGALDGLAGSLELDYCCVDVLDALLAGPEGGAGLEGVPPCDLAVCFGFMHHVPGSALRRALVAALCGRVAPGGIVALSFWQYLRDPRLARRAAAAGALREEDPALAALRLEAGDGFLGWQDDPSPLRYCHSFTEEEVDGLAALAAGLGFEEAGRWSADGPAGDLNRYLVLRRHAS